MKTQVLWLMLIAYAAQGAEFGETTVGGSEVVSAAVAASEYAPPVEDVYAEVRVSANQSIGSSTWTDVDFDTVISDVYGLFNASANRFEFTDESLFGTYMVIFNCRMYNYNTPLMRVVGVGAAPLKRCNRMSRVYITPRIITFVTIASTNSTIRGQVYAHGLTALEVLTWGHTCLMIQKIE